MKDVNIMSYQELLDLEKAIAIAKSKFYSAMDLMIVEGHPCTMAIKGNYNFLGESTPVEYRDVFSGELVNYYSIVTNFPRLERKLEEHNIPHNVYMTLSELEDAWNEYKKNTQSL